MHIQGIIFDFGRIIAPFDHMRACSALGSRVGIYTDEVYNQLFGSGLTKRHETGTITSEDFFDQARVLLGDECISYDEFTHIWGDIFAENVGFMEVMSRLNPGIPRVILSNTDPIHWSFIRELPAMKAFFTDSSRWILSFQVGASKPSSIMYNEAMNKLGTEIASTLYLDDIPGYREAFKSMGGISEPYDCSIDPISVLDDIFRDHDLYV